MDKETIAKLQGLLGAEESKSSKVMMAPDMGGDFKSDGFSMSRGLLSANLGEYSTNTGKNYYGYAGYQPLSVGTAKLGGAVGGYGPDLHNINSLTGLLASSPLFGGELKAVIAPGGKIMLNFDKRF